MESMEISILDVLKTLIKKWWIIVLSTVLCAVVLFLYSTFNITPMYGLTIEFYVAPEFGNSQITSASTAYQTTTYAREAMKTYIKLLANADFFDMLEKEIDGKCIGNYTSSSLSSKITYAEQADTDLFRATVYSKYPEDAYSIAVELAEIAPQRIYEVKGFKALTVTNAPKFERVRRTNNVVNRNTIIGGLFGALVSSLILVVIKIFDVRIATESDLTKFYDVPVLGVIPNFDEVIKDNRNSKYGYGGRYGEKSKQ